MIYEDTCKFEDIKFNSGDCGIHTSHTNNFVVDYVDEGSEEVSKVKSGWTVTKVNGVSSTFENLNEALLKEEQMTLTFQVKDKKKEICCTCLFETQPLKDRLVWFRKSKLHNDKPEHTQILRRQFPLRLTYCMTINKAQGKKVLYKILI